MEYTITRIYCGHCGDFITKINDLWFENIDPDNALCYPCAMAATGTTPEEV